MVPNSEYEDWLAVDQQVFSFLLTSISKEIFVHITMANTTTDAWENWKNSSLLRQERAHAISTHVALANSCKGSLSVAEYLAKMQSLGNDMAVVGKSLDGEDLVQYILVGLDEDYDSVMNSILACPQAITVSELASQMLAFESHVELRSGSFGSSANFAKQGGHGGFSRGTGRR
jgi:hypothetical protein